MQPEVLSRAPKGNSPIDTLQNPNSTRKRITNALKKWWHDEQALLREHDRCKRDPSEPKGWAWRPQGIGPK